MTFLRPRRRDEAPLPAARRVGDWAISVLFFLFLITALIVAFQATEPEGPAAAPDSITTEDPGQP